MKRVLILICAASLVVAAPARRRRSAAPAPVDLSHATIIHDVSVVDVVNGNIEPHRNVAIRGERIVAVGPAVKPPATARVIAGKGKFLIPGLWDMHVHLWDDDPHFAAYLANGVTGVRDMGANFPKVKEWRERIHEGKLTGPRIAASGPPIDGPGDKCDARMNVRIVSTPDDARRAFDQIDDMKVDFMAIMPGLSEDAYRALTEFTRHWGHRVAGYLPGDVTALDAANARQGSIEDLDGILLSCASNENELRRARREAIRNGDAAALAQIIPQAVANYSPEKAALIFREMRIYEVMEDPMLSARRRAQLPECPRAVRDMAVNGVSLLAGTDTGFENTAPGAELHKELELMVAAGLSPAQALRAATLAPAHSLRQDENLGSIAPKKYADLVLLNADPLVDISNTSKIAAVFVNGRVLTQPK